jgi:hypothetical protein
VKKKEQIAILEATLKRNPNNQEAKEALASLKSPHKYQAKPTEIDNIKFDSKKEAEYFRELKLRQRAGEIEAIELQPEFVLQEPFYKNGKHHRAIKFRADFRVTYPDGRVEIIDVKGYKTKEFKIKQKLFEARYPELELVIL